jgi:hypothetical protein
MALSVSATQTTLWDQFNYSGNPADFAWILPIRHDPSVRIAVADERFLGALDLMSRLSLELPPPPPPPCPSCPSFCWRGSQDAAVFSDAPAFGIDTPNSVDVVRQEIVGPYQVAIVNSNNANDLRRWLTDNGYAVPPSIEPVIDYYVGLQSDFIALRLRPGVGINRMTPVRVTTAGYAPTLPLRMVAAGVSDIVGLELFVIAASRFEASNFSNATLSDDDFTFDYAVQSWPPSTAQDLLTAVRRAHRSNGSRTWLTQKSTASEPQNFAFAVRSFASPFASGPSVCFAADGGPPEDAPGQDAGCRDADYNDELMVATRTLSGPIWLTRLSAELPSAMLDRDLQLAPSVDNSAVSGLLRYGHQLRYPAPPVCPPLHCEDPCDAGQPGDAAVTTDGAARFDASARTDGGSVYDDTGRLVIGGGCNVRCTVAHGTHRARPRPWTYLLIASLVMVLTHRRTNRLKAS